MRIIGLAIVIGLLCGCNGTVPNISKTATQLSPVSANGIQTKTINVSKVIDFIGEGVVVGKSYGGKLCIFTNDIVWYSDDRPFEVSTLVRKKLAAYGYNILTKADSPFTGELQSQADFLLGGRVVDMETNICSSIDGMKGQIFFKINWDVFDTKSKKVVLTIETKGSSNITEFQSSQMALFVPAFNMATDNLLADRRFFELLVNTKPGD